MQKQNVLEQKVSEYNPMSSYKPGDWVEVYEDDLGVKEADVFVKSEVIVPGLDDSDEHAGVVTACVMDDLYGRCVTPLIVAGLMNDDCTFTERAIPLLESAIKDEFTKRGGVTDRISIVDPSLGDRLEIEAAIGKEFYDKTYREVRDSIFVPLLRTAEDMAKTEGGECPMTGFMTAVLKKAGEAALSA